MARSAAQPAYGQLVALVAALRARVAAPAAENARLRAERAAARGEDGPPPPAARADASAATPTGRRKRPPGGAKANVVVVARRRPRRPRAPGPGRRREVPDRVVAHAPTTGAGCGGARAGGRLVGRRQVVALPPVRAGVVEPQARERRGRACGWSGRGALPDLGGQVGPHRRVGWGGRR